MRGYAEDAVFLTQHLVLFERAQLVVLRIEEPVAGTYRCHEVTRFVFRAMKNVLQKYAGDAIVEDGIFAGVEHSWIRLSPYVILDVYSVARLPMVQLLDVGTPTLLRSLYKADPIPRSDIREDALSALWDEYVRIHEFKRDEVKTWLGIMAITLALRSKNSIRSGTSFTKQGRIFLRSDTKSRRRSHTPAMR